MQDYCEIFENVICGECEYYDEYYDRCTYYDRSGASPAELREFIEKNYKIHRI